MASSLVRELVEAGIHFGHRVSRWNPKMGPYIFGKRNMIHIIDLRETIKGLLRAKKFLAQVVAGGKDVLFVGTKRQAKQLVQDYATRTQMHYVSERWLGGTLTNFRTIRSRLSRLEELEGLEQTGEIQEYSKKMIASLTREKRKIARNLEGIRNMNRMPGALIVLDPHREYIAAREAKKLGIPTICLIDTDGDPDDADIPIPGNDDAIRSIEIILRELGGAIEQGRRGRDEPRGPAEEVVAAAAAAAGPSRRRVRRTAAGKPKAAGAAEAAAQEPAPIDPMETAPVAPEPPQPAAEPAAEQEAPPQEQQEDSASS